MPLLRCLVLLAAVVAGVVVVQNHLLYYPERASVEALLPHSTLAAVQAWPTAVDFRGLLAEPPDGPVRGTIIVFHGNAGHAGHRLFYAEQLRVQGWRVLLAEYPGYGPREGALGEESLVADAVATIALAQRAFGPVVLLGESLGAAVAAAASARLQHAGIAGLLLVTPWDRLVSVAAHHYPWLPVRGLLRDRYDNVLHLHGYQGRIVVVLAEDDSIVPAVYGRALFDSLGAGRVLRIVAGADHNDWFARTDAAWWRQTLATFPQTGLSNAPVD